LFYAMVPGRQFIKRMGSAKAPWLTDCAGISQAID